MERERERIELPPQELLDLWDGVYFESNIYELNGENYQQVLKISTSEYSDGDSWDYIIQRESDKKYFKFNVWDAGEHNGYIFEDEYIEEVFPKIIETTIYE
jgi:hypothetical protein